jgi:putative DNA primase/helicase
MPELYDVDLDADGGAGDGGSVPRLRVDDDAWRDLLIMKTVKQKNGAEFDVVAANLSNVVTIIRYHPKWRGVLAWDAFGERVVTRQAPPWHAAVAPSTIEDGVFRETDIARTIDWLVRNEGLAVGPKVVEQAIPVVAEANAFHPVREYLESLVWDGVERLPRWLSTYAGVEQSEYSATIGTCWLISAVARPMEPGCQVDTMLILESPKQGTKKSTLFRNLVPHPSMYSETGVDIGQKDSYAALHGTWIYLLDELDSLKRGEVTRTKNFLTSIKDHYRPSYGRLFRDFYRQNVFAGTTNEGQYLVDKTGNRRFWPARVVRPIDIAALVRDRDQLWAEAFDKYASGHRWYADTPELRALCEAEQAERVQGDPWESIVGAWLESGPARVFDQGGFLTSDVLTKALNKQAAEISKYDEQRIADVLKALDYERGSQRREHGTRVRRYTKSVTSVTGVGDTSDTEKKASESLVSPTSPTKETSRTREGGNWGAAQEVGGAVSVGDVGDGDGSLFGDDLAELGIGE